jgi:hypothetical protein
MLILEKQSTGHHSLPQASEFLEKDPRWGYNWARPTQLWNICGNQLSCESQQQFDARENSPASAGSDVERYWCEAETKKKPS